MSPGDVGDLVLLLRGQRGFGEEKAERMQGVLTDFTELALLESFLVHARLLDGFLSRPKTRDDDVVAADYVTGWTCAAALTSRERTAIDKQVAHLTAARQAKEWFQTSDMRRRPCALFVSFADRLGPDERVWFAETVDLARAGAKPRGVTFVATTTN